MESSTVQIFNYFFTMKNRSIFSYLYHFRIQFAFGSSAVKGFKYQISSLTGFIGGFMLLESNMNIAVVRVGRSVCE